MRQLVFVDSEIDLKGNICDLGAIKEDGSQIHTADKNKFKDFVKHSGVLVGHNIVHHDAKYIGAYFSPFGYKLIDTLYLSPLLFPEKPYHKLIKDEKIISEEKNNPLADSIKCRDLFYDEVNAFDRLDKSLKTIFGTLLYNHQEFSGFFEYVEWNKTLFLKSEIKTRFHKLICDNVDISKLIGSYPVELAYALAIISIFNNPNGKESITPPWIIRNYPSFEGVLKTLRGIPCSGCDYCNGMFNPKKRLKDIFGYDNFRLFNGENLQEKAVETAIRGKSLLAIFPTGGGKSITFQLPALVSGEAEKALTIVISPLQSLMKDQVDNLEKKGSADAVTINGLLSPIERAEAIERVSSGKATILYIAPESLRSKTIEKVICGRNIARFVIDEAHCFSSWGQDFRVDYQYIGTFIKKIEENKGINNIPVSCFTATAKQKVVSDIQDYFKEKCNLSLELFTTSVTRANLTYKVLPKNNDDEKYQALREIILEHNAPTIVFVSSVSQTEKLAKHLTNDGINALPFNGQMDRNEKVINQNAFISNKCQVMVATSAFGMGVDKSDIKLVIHYDISDSLENYIQEAGRAGRDQSIQANCYVLFCEDDLNKHFLLLNQTKLTINEIQQVWQAIKQLSKNKVTITNSALEIAREAGWDDSKKDIETRVKTAINTLENSGYIKRGMNSPRVYATSIAARTLIEAKDKALKSNLFEKCEEPELSRILSLLFSERSRSKANTDDAESRVDYIADILGIEKFKVISIINRLRQANILSDENDMAATFNKADSSSKITKILNNYAQLERFIFKSLSFKEEKIDLKELNEKAILDGVKGSSVKAIKTILLYWTIKGYIQKNFNISSDTYTLSSLYAKNEINKKIEYRLLLANFIAEYLLSKARFDKDNETVEFSIVELINKYNTSDSLFKESEIASESDVRDALLYLSKINALNLEGGFLVLYSGIQITRLVTNNAIRYKQEDYKILQNYYNLKIQQIHIVGEYANMMVKDYNEALNFVNDYFTLEYDGFIKKYFKGNRRGEIQKNITPKKYNMLFGSLSEIQKQIIDDDESKNIAVIAGPGSGKTRVLVHKLASLLLLEDIKAEQLLMLTFSRSSATEFKSRLIELIKGAAYYVDIKTFHSYAFDLLGKIGKEEEFDNVIKTATEMIESKEVENEKITKSVLVIDEAQDMDLEEYELVKAILERNEDMRIIAVGDDDQNIYEFRGSDSKYLNSFITELGAKRYELLENYRSVNKVVNFANSFAKTIRTRIKNKPILAIRKDDGRVAIIKHNTENMEQSICNHLLKKNDKGKIAILTNTNNDALRMLGFLTENGFKAQLIESSDGFELYNLMEVRAFIKLIENETSPIISFDTWLNAKNNIKEKFKDSRIINTIMIMLQTFENINKTYYLSDFIEFTKESHFEDFLFNYNEKIIVSTIHKAKGHEFDTVYLLLRDNKIIGDKEKRKLYVGMTRAKNELYIHTNNDSFDSFKLVKGIEYFVDPNEYSTPKSLTVELSHRDVVLDFFKNKKEKILILKSGNQLDIDGCYLSYKGSRLVKFSIAFTNKVKELNSLGYRMISANIRFIVAWKDIDEVDSKETAIILPNLYFKYNPDSKEDILDKSQQIIEDVSTIQENIKQEKIVVEEINNIDIQKGQGDDSYELDKEIKGSPLYKKLRSYRMIKSKEEAIAPYCVFHDTHLVELVKKLPKNRTEFMSIKGLGSSKFDKYGEDILNIIKKYCDKDNEKV